MTTIHPSSFLVPLQTAIASYEGLAPAVLLEVARAGLSAQAVTGDMTLGQDAPATPQAQFHIGSQTKMMTGAVVLQLAAEGRFSLDDKVSDVMDAAALSGIANIEEATLRQLLTHSSGIPDYVNDFVNDAGIPTLWERLLETPPRQVGADEAIEFLVAQNAPAEFAPGESTDYSNTGFLLLQLVTEHVAGSPLADVLQARIFDPLGMEDSSFPGIARPDGIISSYANLDGNLIDVTHLPIDDAGDGGVVSTTADMIKFMQALVVDRTLVPESQLDGLGQFFDAVGFSEGAFLGHDGGTVGTTSMSMVHMPTGTVFSVALSLAGETANLSTLWQEITTNVLNSEAWSEFETGETPLDFAISAAELAVSEVSGPDGTAQVHLDMQGIAVVLDGTLADLETGDLTFLDGSILFVSENSNTQFSVAEHAVDALRADNHLMGQGGNDLLTGGHGNDLLQGGAGNDRLDGASGHDVARYHGDQSQFTMTIGRDGIALTDRSAASGTDRLISIEQVDFASSSIDLSAYDGLGAVSAADLYGIIELYTAYFNRAPDAAGLAFWGAALANGTTLTEAAALFMDQDETRQTYPEGLSNAAFTDAIYANVFGREADPAGKEFWIDVLNDGANEVGRDHFILAVLAGAKATPPPDATAEFNAQQMRDQAYLEGKTDIATYYAATLGMTEVAGAASVMDLFDGSQTSLNAARAEADQLFEMAVTAEGGSFLVPIVGILDDPFL